MTHATPARDTRFGPPGRMRGATAADRVDVSSNTQLDRRPNQTPAGGRFLGDR
jgi:hypothetical protein